MKKLTLALVCLIGVAFLSSCDPKNVVENPQPSIAFMTGETFIADGDVLDYFGIYDFGVKAASNPETLEDLARLVISFKSGELSETLLDTVISGKEFTFQDEILFYEDEKTIIGSFEITAEVTDAAGEKSSVTLKCDVDLDDTLEPYEFEWFRHAGNDAEGLEYFGLKWERNVKDDIFAVIEPLEGAQLYILEPKDWEETQTETELAALLSEATAVDSFREVSCTAPNKDYDIVIATTYNGINYLIHVEHSQSVYIQNVGTDVTITGHFK